jgi:hypothetical protein
MDSNTLTKIQNSNQLTMKVIGDITGTVGSAKAYYYKPSYPCRIIGAKLYVNTAPGAGVSVALTKSVMSDITCPKDVVVTGNTEASAVSSSALFAMASGTTNDTAVVATLGANWKEQRDVDVSADEAIKIAIPSNTTTAMGATIILEIQPL